MFRGVSFCCSFLVVVVFSSIHHFVFVRRGGLILSSAGLLPKTNLSPKDGSIPSLRTHQQHVQTRATLHTKTRVWYVCLRSRVSRSPTSRPASLAFLQRTSLSRLSTFGEKDALLSVPLIQPPASPSRIQAPSATRAQVSDGQKQHASLGRRIIACCTYAKER